MGRWPWQLRGAVWVLVYVAVATAAIMMLLPFVIGPWTADG